MYHLKNGASDTNDTVGTQVVTCQGSNMMVTGAGLMVDYNQDIFVSEYYHLNSETNQRTWLYTNWNGGILPPEDSGTNLAEGFGVIPPAWAVGASNVDMTGIYDTVLNSRVNPTLVAVAMVYGDLNPQSPNGYNGGIRLLNATNGSIVVSNLDVSNWYNGVAFDNVGNIYGASRSTNYWRVWSPPGTNQATTVAVATFTIPGAVTSSPITITGISVNGTTVTINFTCSSGASASAFTLYGSSTANGTFSPVAGATVSQAGANTFTATTTTSGSSHFYRVYGP